MIMLSHLQRYQVTDTQGRIQSIDDFAIDLAASVYAPIDTLLLHRADLKPVCLPWAQVRSIDHRARLIRVEDLDQTEDLPADWIERAVLLKRDILDALMLDLHSRAPVLANDVGLEENEGQLRLTYIDISFFAILRRLSGGRLHIQPNLTLRDWKYIEFLRGDPASARLGLNYHHLIDRLPPGEIAYLTGFLPYLYAAELITLLPDTLATDTLEKMIPEMQLQAFEELDQEKATRLLGLMRPDIAADLLSRLDPDRTADFLEHVAREQSERVLQLLRYPDYSAGGLMTNDMITLPANITVEAAIADLMEKLKQPAYINFNPYIYIVDSEADQRLLGYLSLRDLLAAKQASRLERVMNPYVISLTPTLAVNAAARRVVESGLPALPVLAENGRLLGIVTLDAALSMVLPASHQREVLRIIY